MCILCMYKIGCLTPDITSVEIVENSKFTKGFIHLEHIQTTEAVIAQCHPVSVSEPYRVVSCRALDAVCKDSLYNPMHDPPN